VNAFRSALAVLALASGVFWAAIGAAIVTDGNPIGWAVAVVGVGLVARGWWIVRSLRIARAQRRALAAPRPPAELVWPGGRARGFDWEGEPLPSVDTRVAGVRSRMASSPPG
jgi:hypothetical protein